MLSAEEMAKALRDVLYSFDLMACITEVWRGGVDPQFENLCTRVLVISLELQVEPSYPWIFHPQVWLNLNPPKKSRALLLRPAEAACVSSLLLWASEYCVEAKPGTSGFQEKNYGLCHKSNYAIKQRFMPLKGIVRVGEVPASLTHLMPFKGIKTFPFSSENQNLCIFPSVSQSF